MNELNLSVTKAPENHLSAELMYQYLDNQLAPADRHQVEMHLLDCDLCNDALAGLSISSKEKTQHYLFDIQYHLKNRIQRRNSNNILQHLKNWGVTTAILFIVLLAAIIVWYQVKQASTIPNTKPDVTMVQNNPARPVTGEDGFKSYIQTNLRYPEPARQLQVSGSVTVSFRVNTDSTLSDFRIIKGVRYDMNQEAIRLLKEGPAWIPARQNSKPVSDRKTITIPFELNK